MSRLWDTQEFWTRSEADEMLREMNDAAPGALADSLERNAANYDGGPEIMAAIVAELRRRGAAGVRFWPEPQGEPADPAPRLAKVELAVEESIADLIDDEIPW